MPNATAEKTPAKNRDLGNKESFWIKLIKFPFKFLLGPTVAIVGAFLAAAAGVIAKTAELIHSHIKRFTNRNRQVVTSLFFQSLSSLTSSAFKKSINFAISPYKNIGKALGAASVPKRSNADDKEDVRDDQTSEENRFPVDEQIAQDLKQDEEEAQEEKQRQLMNEEDMDAGISDATAYPVSPSVDHSKHR